MEHVLSYDTETTGMRFYDERPAKMFAYSTGDTEGRTAVYRLDGSALRQRRNAAHLEDLMSGKYRLVMHNSKFDITATNKYLGKHLEDSLQFHDTFIQSHLLQNDHPTHRLKEVARELAGVPVDDERDIKSFLRGGADYSQVPEAKMNAYQHGDAFRTILLHEFFYPKIASNPKLLDVYEAELNAIRVTIKMERRGFHLNKRRCRALVEKLRVDAETAKQRLNHELGTTINPNSPPQVIWALYHFAKLPVLKRTKTKIPSTDKDVLFQLRQLHPHPILDLILQYRSYSRGVGILEGYLGYADSEGIIHSNLKTCAAITGRQSSAEPNIHNVSKTTTLLTPFPIPAREVFTPRPGFFNTHIDYAGEELRLLVHYAQERELVELINRNGDPHDLAAQIFYEDRYLNAVGDEKKTLRGSAKNTNFAIPYGASLKQVAATLGLPLEVARRRLLNYETRFPRLCKLTDSISKMVERDGGVTTVFGRFLRVPRETAYVGTNYLIQGTAAEILKRAQWRIYNVLQKETGGAAQLIMTIHDEVIIEWPREMLPDLVPVMRKVREVMIDFPEFSVPLEIEASLATKHWAAKREINLNA